MTLGIKLFKKKVLGFIPLDIPCSLVCWGILSLAPLFEGFLQGRETYVCLG